MHKAESNYPCVSVLCVSVKTFVYSIYTTKESHLKPPCSLNVYIYITMLSRREYCGEYDNLLFLFAYNYNVIQKYYR